MNINYNRVIKDMENKNNYKIRYKLVKFALEFSKKEAAREFKTTVQTVRRWVNRYNKEGLKGLDDQSRKPHYSRTGSLLSINSSKLGGNIMT